LTAGTLRLGVLGSLLVERDGEPAALPRAAVVRGLLGVLLVAEGQALSADRLIELVWAGRQDRIGRGSVYVGVSRLRQWLGQAVDPGEAVIDQGVDGYRLIVDPDAVDLSRFRALFATAMGTTDPAGRCRLLQSALELSRGPVLAGLTGLDTFDPLLKSVEDSVREATLAFGACALAAERPQVAVAAVDAMAAANPLDEPVYALLLELLAACGRPAEALARYELLRARLADELGTSPSEEVQQARLAVLGQDQELALRSPTDPAPAPPTIARPNLLPPDVGYFTGRDQQAKALFDLLDQDGEQPTAVVITAIAGTAGVGKSALAVHWAHQVRDRFPDGQLYVNLRGYSTAAPARPIEALAVLLHALGVPAERIPVTVEQAAGLYRTLLADKRVLVVLDNAHSADQVRPLLPGGAGCLVLVTSRDRLAGLVAREGARRLTLDVLAPDEAGELLARIIGDDRARAEPKAIAELARVCAFLPLAMRNAAANLADQPHRIIADYANELREGNRLAALTVEDDEQGAARLAFDLSDAQPDTLNSVATIHQRRGNHQAAVAHHQQALRQARQAETRYPEVAALVGLAAAHQGLDQPEQAGACAWQALTLAREASYRVLEGQALTTLADLHRSLGRLDQAIEHAQQALAIHRDTGHRLGEARTLLVLGHVLRDIGGAEAGLPQWEEALALFTSVGAREADHVRTLLDHANRVGQPQ
jgi:DNA-binding SARP family transcriptional activator